MISVYIQRRNYRKVSDTATLGGRVQGASEWTEILL